MAEIKIMKVVDAAAVMEILDWIRDQLDEAENTVVRELEESFLKLPEEVIAKKGSTEAHLQIIEMYQLGFKHAKTAIDSVKPLGIVGPGNDDIN